MFGIASAGSFFPMAPADEIEGLVSEGWMDDRIDKAQPLTAAFTATEVETRGRDKLGLELPQGRPSPASCRDAAITISTANALLMTAWANRRPSWCLWLLIPRARPCCSPNARASCAPMPARSPFPVAAWIRRMPPPSIRLCAKPMKRSACNRPMHCPSAISDPYQTGTGYRIIPVVAIIKPDLVYTLNPDEVDAAFEVPLAFLMEPGNRHLHHREFEGIMRSFYAIPFGDHYIWALPPAFSIISTKGFTRERGGSSTAGSKAPAFSTIRNCGSCSTS